MPPKPSGKNTATREYYAPNAATDSVSDEDIDWPESSPSSQKKTKAPAELSPSPSEKPKTTTGDGTEKGREEKLDSTSPTPSDVVLSADFRDVGVLGAENRRMVEEGVGVGERRRRLEGLRGELEGRRGREEVEKEKGKKREDEE